MGEKESDHRSEGKGWRECYCMIGLEEQKGDEDVVNVAECKVVSSHQ